MNTLYKNIKETRIKKNITQQELAESVGYKNKSMIAQIEKGSVDLPSSMVERFANALGVTSYYLMFNGMDINEWIDPFDKYLSSIGIDLNSYVDSDTLTDNVTGAEITINDPEYTHVITYNNKSIELSSEDMAALKDKVKSYIMFLLSEYGDKK